MKSFSRIAWVGCLWLAVCLVSACDDASTRTPAAAKPPSSQAVAAGTQPSGATKNDRVTVDAVAQPRPGVEPRLTRLSVHAAPVDPPTVSADEARLLERELVVGTVVNGQAIAYPIRYLALSEVVNHQYQGVPIAATWCPLSGTAQLFDRRVNGQTLTFDFASGLMHDNLLVVDRQTRSVWSQLARRAISGDLKDTSLQPLASVQATWSHWRQHHPQTRVMVYPGQTGRPYLYHDFRAPHEAGQRYHKPAGSHDISNVGLGVILGTQTWFFPFNELARAHGPVKIASETRTFTVHYDPEGIAAWADANKGTPLAASVAYRRGWVAFYPRSHIYHTQ